jgi:hypothetical protein
MKSIYVLLWSMLSALASHTSAKSVIICVYTLKLRLGYKVTPLSGRERTPTQVCLPPVPTPSSGYYDFLMPTAVSFRVSQLSHRCPFFSSHQAVDFLIFTPEKGSLIYKQSYLWTVTLTDLGFLNKSVYVHLSQQGLAQKWTCNFTQADEMWGACT